MSLVFRYAPFDTLPSIRCATQGERTYSGRTDLLRANGPTQGERTTSHPEGAPGRTVLGGTNGPPRTPEGAPGRTVLRRENRKKLHMTPFVLSSREAAYRRISRAADPSIRPAAYSGRTGLGRTVLLPPQRVPGENGKNGKKL